MTHHTDAELLRDIEEHMRKMWDARLLPAVCWPADLAQRLTQAVRRAPAAPVPHTAPCLECERCGLPPINHNLSHWCDSQSFAAAPQPTEVEENPLQEQLDEALQSLEFYKRRCDLLQSIQPRMRDPERTMVCDVLANGHLLQGGDGQPDKARYAPPEAAPVVLPEPSAWISACQTIGGGVDWKLSWSKPGAGVRHRLSGEEFEHPLYTEQQVRDLLAAHGIQERST